MRLERLLELCRIELRKAPRSRISTDIYEQLDSGFLENIDQFVNASGRVADCPYRQHAVQANCKLLLDAETAVTAEELRD